MSAATPEWIVRALVVALCITICAHAIGETARLFGRARRWVWIGAMLVTVVTPWLGMLSPWHGPIGEWMASLFEVAPSTLSGGMTSGHVSTPVPMVHTTAISTVMSWFTLAWLMSSLLTLGVFSALLWRFHTARTRWRTGHIGGAPVLIASDVGPAVIGVRRPAIVVPSWVLDLSDAEQWLIARHEGEHVRAGDARVLGAGIVCLVAMPWNVMLWWQFRQLRTSIETDCDERVLADGVDRREYGTLLLKTAARSMVSLPVIPALSGRKSLLEQRILAMSHSPARHRVVRALSLSLTAAFIGVVACDTAASPKSAAVPPTVTDSSAVLNNQVTSKTPMPLSALVKNGSVTLATSPNTAHTRVRIRTLSTLNPSSGPLVLVNGVEVKKTAGETSPLDQVDPNKIAKIDVLKGPVAIKTYGARAAGGVISITLKK